MSNSKANSSKKWLLIAVLVTGIALAIGGIFLLVNRNNKPMSNPTQPISVARNSKLEDIKFNNDKINIYLFWGNGCIHCEHLYELLDEIWPEYSQYANLYAFEIWNNQENGKIHDYFLEQFGHKTGVRSTPYFVIGDQEFDGYSEANADKVKEAIKREYADRANVRDFSGVLDLVK